MDRAAISCDFYTVEEASKILNKSRSWVYRHANALRAFQPAKGCALSFPATIIQRIKEGTHAIHDENRPVASGENDSRSKENKNLCNQRRSIEVGGGSDRKRLAEAKSRDTHGILV